MELISNQVDWDRLKKKLKRRYPKLTKADLQHFDGMEDGMLRMVAYKLQKTKQEIQEIIDGFTSVALFLYQFHVMPVNTGYI